MGLQQSGRSVTMSRFNEQLITFSVMISTASYENLFDTEDMFQQFVDVIKNNQTDEYGNVQYIHGKCSLQCERIEK
jgi:hypothetical protein